MVVGILIGHSIPQIPAILGSMEIAGISIPIAVLIWIMIYPMMIKVDFQSVREVGRNPKGLFVTWITNWLIKPFTMYFIAYVFLYDVFASFMTPELARQYLAGAVLLGAAPCTAMVFVWSTLTHGNPAYTVVQVATNDLIILIAFVPIVNFFWAFRRLSFRIVHFLSVSVYLSSCLCWRELLHGYRLSGVKAGIIWNRFLYINLMGLRPLGYY